MSCRTHPERWRINFKTQVNAADGSLTVESQSKTLLTQTRGSERWVRRLSNFASLRLQGGRKELFIIGLDSSSTGTFPLNRVYTLGTIGHPCSKDSTHASLNSPINTDIRRNRDRIDILIRSSSYLGQRLYL